MKGAMADDCAKISITPSRSSTETIGINHQSFRSHRKPSSSPMMPTRRFAARSALGIRPVLSDEVIAEDQGVHAAAHERGMCLRRRVDDGLAAEVEGRVQDDGDARGLTEALDQVVVARV